MPEFTVPSPIAVLRSTGFLVGLAGSYANIQGFLAPHSYALFFGFTPSSPTVQHADSNPFIRVATGRSLGSCLALLACTYYKNNRAVGILLTSFFLGGLADGIALLQSEHGEMSKDNDTSEGKEKRRKTALRAAWNHWGTTFAFATVGVWGLYHC